VVAFFMTFFPVFDVPVFWPIVLLYWLSLFILIPWHLHSLPLYSCRAFFPFWTRYALTKAIVVAFFMTFFPVFDVPVFWPILLLYWLSLFILTMKRQIKHMIKYKYVPFSLGKQVRTE